MKYRFNSKEQTLSIGIYLEVSLLEAREIREDVRKLLKEGFTPILASAKLIIRNF